MNHACLNNLSGESMLQEFSVIYNTQLTTSEFNTLSSYIYNNFGIKMPPAKRIMLQSRLHRRLRALGMHSFGEYIKYLFSPEGKSSEVVEMMNVVSTNKTDFFREPVHFDFIEQHLLDQYNVLGNSRAVNIWSAGCSSGEEAYSLGITFEENKRKGNPLDYYIYGTDISTAMLQRARAAIYPAERINMMPIKLQRKYFLASKDKEVNLVKVVPELRKHLALSRLNFMDSRYVVDRTFDIIFCRNVLIYFDRDMQEQVINRLCNHLHPGGFFFLGHSESVNGLNVPLKQLQPTIYQRV